MRDERCVNCRVAFENNNLKRCGRRKLDSESLACLCEIYNCSLAWDEIEKASHELSYYLCKTCFNKLTSLQNAKAKVVKLENEISNDGVEENIWQLQRHERTPSTNVKFQTRYKANGSGPSTLPSLSSSPLKSPPRKKIKLELFPEEENNIKKCPKGAKARKVLSQKGSPVVQV